jgi:hypothetical protein
MEFKTYKFFLLPVINYPNKKEQWEKKLLDVVLPHILNMYGVLSFFSEALSEMRKCQNAWKLAVRVWHMKKVWEVRAGKCKKSQNSINSDSK